MAHEEAKPGRASLSLSLSLWFAAPPAVVTFATESPVRLAREPRNYLLVLDAARFPHLSRSELATSTPAQCKSMLPEIQLHVCQFAPNSVISGM